MKLSQETPNEKIKENEVDVKIELTESQTDQNQNTQLDLEQQHKDMVNNRRRSTIDILSKDLKALVTNDTEKNAPDMIKVSKWAYTLGNLNVALTVYIMASYPQYFPVYYLLKMAILIPTIFSIYFDRKEYFYLIEICWVVFYTQFFLLIWSLLDDSDNVYRQRLWNVLYMFTGGFLSWATIIFNNRLIITSIYSTASVFIHFSPLALYYVVYWHNAEVRAVWPGINIKLDWNHLDVLFDSFQFYLVWWAFWNFMNMTVIYEYKDDPSVDYLWKLNKRKWGLDELFSCVKNERVHIFLYSLMHMIMAVGLLQFSLIVDYDKWVYFVWMVSVFTYIVYGGAVWMVRDRK